MRVTFWKMVEERLSTWEAVRGKPVGERTSHADGREARRGRRRWRALGDGEHLTIEWPSLALA